MTSRRTTRELNGSPTGGGGGNGSPFTMIAFNDKLYFNCTPNGATKGLCVRDPAPGPDNLPSLVGGTSGADPICLMTANFALAALR
jgi:hypothetical protein